MLEHPLGRDEPVTPGTGDELAGDQRGMTPATLGGLLARDPRRPDGVRTLPAGLRDDLRQQLVFAQRTLVVRGLDDQPVFHHAFSSLALGESAATTFPPLPMVALQRDDLQAEVPQTPAPNDPHPNATQRVPGPVRRARENRAAPVRQVGLAVARCSGYKRPTG